MVLLSSVMKFSGLRGGAVFLFKNKIDHASHPEELTEIVQGLEFVTGRK